MSLAECFPSPVPFTLAGRPCVARQFRLGDLVTLDAWVSMRQDSPGDLALCPAKDPGERRLRLRRAYDLAGDHVRRGFGSREGDEILFGTLEGQSRFLRIALRPMKPTPLSVTALATEMAPDDWRRLEMLAFAIDPFEEISRLIDDELGIVIPEESAERGRMDWRKTVSALSERYGWANPETVRKLYLSQWRMLLIGGEPPEHSDRLPSDPRLADEVQAKRAAFWAEGSARASASISSAPAAAGVDADALGRAGGRAREAPEDLRGHGQ